MRKNCEKFLFLSQFFLFSSTFFCRHSEKSRTRGIIPLSVPPFSFWDCTSTCTTVHTPVKILRSPFSPRNRKRVYVLLLRKARRDAFIKEGRRLATFHPIFHSQPPIQMFVLAVLSKHKNRAVNAFRGRLNGNIKFTQPLQCNLIYRMRVVAS